MLAKTMDDIAVAKRPKPGRGKLLALKISLVIGSTAIGILVCEIAVRLLGMAPGVHAIWMTDDLSIYQRAKNPLLNHELKPGFTAEFPVGKTSANSHGLRDRERSIEKPEGTRRIGVLGDSVVEGVNYVSDEDTISRHLERLYADEKTEVLNLGVSGYCTIAEVELLKTKGLQFDLDELVVIFVSNDFNDVVPDHTTERGVVDRPEWSKRLFLNSHLFRVCCLRFNWFRFNEESSPYARNRDAIGESNVVRALPELRELANEHGFKLLIAVWPAFLDSGIKNYPVVEGEDLLVERLAKMNGIQLIKLDPVFREALRQQKGTQTPREMFSVRGDSIHPNPEAAKIAAMELQRALPEIVPPPYAPGPKDEQAIAWARRLSNESTPVAPRDEIERHYAALSRQVRGDEAEAYVLGLADKLTDNLFVQEKSGMLKFESKEHEAAARYFSRALALSPEDQSIRARLIVALRLAGDESRAKAVLENPSIEKPAAGDLRMCLAQLEIDAGALTNALGHLNAALQAQPDFQPAHDLKLKVEEDIRRARFRAAFKKK
ncbi:MAG: hypothetical protein CMO80_23700 [Verrucomicrobiales bacterium]|nr:hypothetical protein [Verrucomicrobiales bacterium]|tara:strand:+ start:462 stop:2105 length:1644 start_codon:yes stop_codon:yes gene_type:complete